MDIGTRMKENYEFPSRHLLLRRTPVIIRVDGKAFHTYTKNMCKPFDVTLHTCMKMSAYECLRNMQGAKAAYVQSDEASFLLTDYDTLQTQSWLGYVQSKLESITASMFTECFNVLAELFIRNNKSAFFDARAFNVPREDVSNYFLWRVKDWHRNSISMYCRQFFSAKKLHKVNEAGMHEMLHSIGKNWATDCRPWERNGTWVIGDNEYTDALDNYQAVSAIIEPLINRDTMS